MVVSWSKTDNFLTRNPVSAFYLPVQAVGCRLTPFPPLALTQPLTLARFPSLTVSDSLSHTHTRTCSPPSLRPHMVGDDAADFGLQVSVARLARGRLADPYNCCASLLPILSAETNSICDLVLTTLG